MNANAIQNKIELCANIAIVVFVIFAGVVLTKHLNPKEATPSDGFQSIKIGTKLSLPEVNWAKNRQTLLFALKKGCEGCIRSAPFYRRIASEFKTHFRSVALLSEAPQDARRYVNDLGLNVDEVRQVSFLTLGIMYVPSLIVVDTEGVVTNVWVGLPTPEREFEIWNRLQGSSDKGIPEARNEKTITSEELKKEFGGGKHSVLLDVRERKEFLKAHLQGAKNIPADELGVRAKNELNPSNRIVVYCGCYEDFLSKVAYHALENRGFLHVLILRGDLPELKRAGLPVVETLKLP